MIVWTIQPRAALEALERDGVFRCDTRKSFNLSKADSLKKPYQWLIKQMTNRIGAPPEGVQYPIWAWHTWDFKHVCPDPDSAAFLQRTEEKVLFTLDVPENALVLSDFDAWQYVLMGTFVPYAETEEAYDALEAQLEALDGDALTAAIEASWQTVFQTNRVETDALTRGRYVQATFWEIRPAYIREIKRLPPNADRT